MKKYSFPFVLFIIASVFSWLLISSIPEKQPVETKDESSLHYPVSTPVIPEKLDFAGEEVPLNIFYVREALERELIVNVYWHSSTLQIIKRANRYFPEIDRILLEENIPSDFRYLALAESGLLHVVSPAGAAGYWQFLKKTGQQYQLEINAEVDERYHLEKATRAACKYLRDAYQLYSSWTLAAAAYNVGTEGVSRRMGSQRSGNYYEMTFPEETQRYLFRILAMKTILENPSTYGFNVKRKELYKAIPLREVTVDTAIADITAFAAEQGITYRMLREFNPWISSYKLSNASGKKYTFAIPVKKYLEWEHLEKYDDGYQLFEIKE